MNMEHLLAVTNKVVELNNQLTAVTEQRDRLAEALNEIMHHEYCCDREYAKTATIAVEALQSLNQPTINKTQI